MRKLREHISGRRRQLRAGLLLAIGALAVAGYFALSGNTESSLYQTVALDGVPAEELAKNGISLVAPPADYAPVIAASDATAAVVKYNPEAKVKQLVLARVRNDTAVPKTDRVLWIANLDVEGKLMGLHGGPGMAESTPYLYSLVFVDPASGAVLGESSLGAPIPPISPPVQ